MGEMIDLDLCIENGEKHQAKLFPILHVIHEQTDLLRNRDNEEY